MDIYVSNAARRLHKTFFDTTNEDWHFFLNQQLTASWYLAKAFVPGMIDAGWGRIIHINGPDGYSGGWTRIPHSTAKGALRTLTKSLAAGLGEYGITVNDVNPGFMDTVRDYETHPGVTPEYSAQRARKCIRSSASPARMNSPLRSRSCAPSARVRSPAPRSMSMGARRCSGSVQRDTAPRPRSRAKAARKAHHIPVLKVLKISRFLK